MQNTNQQSVQAQVQSNYQKPKKKYTCLVVGLIAVLVVIIAAVVLVALGTAREKASQLSLEIKNPEDGFTTTEDSIKIEGVSLPGAMITINGEDIICDDEGNFSTEVSLVSTENAIRVEASARGKLTNSKIIKVYKKLTIDEFRNVAKEIPYKQLEKNPDDYAGELVHYKGKIWNIKEEDGKTSIQMNVTNEGYGFWDDQIMVSYDETTPFLKDDVVSVYGTIIGKNDYKSVANYNMSAPLIKASYIEK